MEFASAAVVSLPLTARDPDHPPDAVQREALDDVQTSIEVWPLMMACGDAKNCNVGGVSGLPPAPDEPPPPHPETASDRNEKISKWARKVTCEARLFTGCFLLVDTRVDEQLQKKSCVELPPVYLRLYVLSLE